MGTSVFLSYPKPFNEDQDRFITELNDYLVSRGYAEKAEKGSDPLM